MHSLLHTSSPPTMLPSPLFGCYYDFIKVCIIPTSRVLISHLLSRVSGLGLDAVRRFLHDPNVDPTSARLVGVPLSLSGSRRSTPERRNFEKREIRARKFFPSAFGDARDNNWTSERAATTVLPKIPVRNKLRASSSVRRRGRRRAQSTYLPSRYHECV